MSREMKTPAQKKKLSDYQDLAATIMRVDQCRHSAWEEALGMSTSQRSECGGMCDFCFNTDGLAEMVRRLGEIRSAPLVNDVANKGDDSKTEEDGVCSMAAEVLLKCSGVDREDAPLRKEEEKSERRLGRKEGNDASQPEDLQNNETMTGNMAEYFHTCGSCKQEDQPHIMNHLIGNIHCFAAYCQDVLMKNSTHPPEQKMVLDLALVMGACLRPDCEAPHYGSRNIKDHVTLNDDCLKYYEAFIQRHLGWPRSDWTKFKQDLQVMVKRLKKNTEFDGSSTLPYVNKVDQKRHDAAERQRRSREGKRLKSTLDSSLAMENLVLEVSEILQVPCALCWHRFSRPRQQQASSAIKPLLLNDNGEVEERFRSALGGSTPEQHLLFAKQFWICSDCEKNPTTRFVGNLELYQNSQIIEVQSLRAVEIEVKESGKTGLILTHSQQPTIDINGHTYVVPSNVSLENISLTLPTGISVLEDFIEKHPMVLTEDWSNLTQLLVKQSVLPGNLTAANVLLNFYISQLQKAKIARGVKNESRVFGYSRLGQDGSTQILDIVDISQASQSVTETMEIDQEEESTKNDKDFLGAARNIAGSEDHFEAREKEVRSKEYTFGAVNTQLRQKIYDKVDGHVGSCLMNPALSKIITQYDDENQCVDFKCYLRCTEDGIKGCNDCDELHVNLDNVSGMDDPNFVLRRLPLLARYISKKAECFIKHLIHDRVQYYDFWLDYEGGCVFLVGNVWLKQYEGINTKIASGELNHYLEVTKELEAINASGANSTVPTVTLDMEELSKNTSGRVKNLPDVQKNLLKKQTSIEVQGMPSLISFWPKHKGLDFSNQTRQNSAHLLQHAIRKRPIVRLEDIIEEVTFEKSLSAEEFKFKFRIKSLSPAETTVLFYHYIQTEKTLDFTEDHLLELCKTFAKEDEAREKKRFGATTSPIVLYDAFQNGMSHFMAQLNMFGYTTMEEIKRDNKTITSFMTQLGLKFEEALQTEDWREIVANKRATEFLKDSLEMQLGEEVSDSVLCYHLALDINQASSNAEFTVKRSVEEIYIRPYEAFSFAVFGDECEFALRLPGDVKKWRPSRPPVVELGGHSHYDMPILQLALLKSYGKAVSRFSNCGPVRWIDLRNAEKVPRSYRELKRNEDAGDQQVWQNGEKRLVLADGYRSYYMQLPDKVEITPAEFSAWYDRSEENKVTMDLLQENDGFIGPDKMNEQDRVLLGENESRQRDALLPQKILLKDKRTTFTKRRNYVALEWESLGLEEEYNEKALYAHWRKEEQIKHKEPGSHVTDVHPLYFDGKLAIGDIGEQSEAMDVDGGDGGDDGDGGNALSDSLFQESQSSFIDGDDGDNNHSIQSAEDNSHSVSSGPREHESNVDNSDVFTSTPANSVASKPREEDQREQLSEVQRVQTQIDMLSGKQSKSNYDLLCLSNLELQKQFLLENDITTQDPSTPKREVQRSRKRVQFECDSAGPSKRSKVLQEAVVVQKGKTIQPVEPMETVTIQDIVSDIDCPMGMKVSERAGEKAEYITGISPVTVAGHTSSSSESATCTPRSEDNYSSDSGIFSGSSPSEPESSEPVVQQASVVQDVADEARENSLEEIIAEKTVEAGRELNKNEREYLSLKFEQQKIAQIAASARGTEDKKRYTAINNRLKKLKPIEEFLKRPVKSGAERIRIHRQKMSDVKPSNLPTAELNQSTAKITQSSASRTKIIQPIEPMNEQSVLEDQPEVEELPLHQGAEGGEEDQDMWKLVKCKQGSRGGKKCTDILWVGNLDNEGQFISDREIKDYFFKYVEEGYQTIWVRTTVETQINRVVEWVCEFFAKKLGKPEPLTCIGKELILNFKGKAQPGQDLLSSYPQRSLFLLSKGPLPEQFKNHQGKLWQCTGKCGKAQDMRRNIKDKKCNHKILFDMDQPKGMGDHSQRDKHIPVLSCESVSTPTQVIKSFHIFYCV